MWPAGLLWPLARIRPTPWSSLVFGKDFDWHKRGLPPPHTEEQTPRKTPVGGNALEHPALPRLHPEPLAIGIESSKQLDRKSVVEGKSVSFDRGRILGGRDCEIC